jgi:hypothetical protein
MTRQILVSVLALGFWPGGFVASQTPESKPNVGRVYLEPT